MVYPCSYRFPAHQDRSCRRYNLVDISLDWSDDRSRIFQTNHVTFVMRSTTHLLFGRCWQTRSKKSMLLISSIVRSKSSRLETRNGCSSTRLLLVEGWWYWRAPVSVLRKIKPKARLTLKTVVWSAKMRPSCSRREAGLIALTSENYTSLVNGSGG